MRLANLTEATYHPEQLKYAINVAEAKLRPRDLRCPAHFAQWVRQNFNVN